ncbi:MAG: hypothetical protein J7L42_02320, partial [Elusimicrobia bacterium]|nr:hypothetical protein [Elusimicrobiota bacterium]
TAFPIYGYVRATLDIDIFIRPTRQNALRTMKALRDFGYVLYDVDVDDMLSKKILFRQYAVEADIHPFVKGVTFEDVWKNKISEKIGRVSVYFASLEDLIKMKKAANRPKDREDLKFLMRIKKRKKTGVKKNEK